MTLYLLILVAAAFSLWSCSTHKQRPNILFIMSDDHTSQAWGIYNGILDKYAKSNHIRRLAREGVVLNNVFCTNSICVPSRASILTGQYSHQNNVYTLADALDPDSNNIAKVLQRAGYETAVIGKWHLKKRPSGFDHFLVLPGQGIYNDPKLKSKDNWEDANAGGKVFQGFSADVIGDQSIEWLKNRKSNRPFFLMTHFKATHEPFDYPDRYDTFLENETIPEPDNLMDFGPQTNGRSFTGQKLWILYDRWIAAQENPDRIHSSYPGLPIDTTILDRVTERKFIYQKFIKDFLRSGASIDDNIGKILEFLDESGQANTTVVIYTSDQGYFLGEHGMFDKRMMYEEAIRMPFVIRYPEEVPANKRLDDLVLNIDFPALFADYAGIEKPDFIKGKSFRANLRGSTPTDWRSSFYYRYWLHRTERPAHFAIRTEQYKLGFFYGHPLDMTGAIQQTTMPSWEFYDLKRDAGENNNAYNHPEYQDVIEDLKKQLENLRIEVGDTDQDRPVMQEIIERYWD